MSVNTPRYITHLKEVCSVTAPVYCITGQHYGVTMRGLPMGFCPICEPFYAQFNGPFSG